MKNIIVILGTRPEAIKLAPVILEFSRNPGYLVFVCNTEQQSELSRQTLGFFGIKADFNLDVMRPNQTLAGVQARMLTALAEVYADNHFDATIVQGDTMTTLCGALVSFYSRVPVFHVEAGLRSYDLFEPFPEEAARQMVSRVADLHFAPTPLAYEALLRENIGRDKIVLTGNTVIDALSQLSGDAARAELAGKGIRLDDQLVLLTAHRRENHGNRLDRILAAIVELTKRFTGHQFVLPVHPNPNVRDRVYALLSDLPNVILTEPLSYPELVCLMKTAKLVMTDSGGIQEEAPTFGVPVLVIRYETERTEGLSAGLAKLVGADYDRIIAEASAILSQPKAATRLEGSNPYGDGKAARKIMEAINRRFTA
jgi:UDP-N-acetylglucosamine 2-epimerase (non-hydrolysing)